jgi:MFS transporter, DHA3 family, macrolide efflux protein
VLIQKLMNSFLRNAIEMRAFLVIWSGQFVSIIGSGITGFALDLWVYQRTGSVTQYALVALFNVIPPILVSPIAGVFVDRWNRRLTILGSDFLAAIMTGLIALLFFTGNLQVWQIALITTAISTLGVFQRLALNASTKQLVSEKHLEQAVGLSQISESMGSLVVPALAGTLVLIVKMEGVLLIDFATYLVSLVTLLLIKIPAHRQSVTSNGNDHPQSRINLKTIWGELQQAWQYTTAHRGILSLLIYFTIINFLISLVGLLIIPMVLGFLSTSAAGSILSIGGIGSLFGSLLLGFIGGTKYRLTKTMLFGLCLGLCIILLGLHPSSILITVAIFLGMLFFSLINGISEVLFISCVPIEIQGRVFGLQGTITASSIPLAYMVAGPLTDGFFEPLLAKNGALSNTVGQIIGVGSGRGIALLFIILGIAQVIVTISAYSYRPMRKLDHLNSDTAISNKKPA